MTGTPLRDYEAGQKRLSADELNKLVAEVRKLAGLNGDEGINVSREGGGYQLTIPPKRKGFWSEITEESPSDPGLYSWIELWDNNGNLEPLVDGRSGSYGGASANPARDANDKTAVPIGTWVWMFLGSPHITGTTEGSPIRDNWRFITPDLLQVVRVASDQNASGDYDGYVQRWSGTAFVDSERIWIKLG